MTINLSNNNPRVNYTATSGQTAFTIPFDYFDDGDISVYQNGTLKTITTHYTISGSTMTLVTGATAGDKIAITRDVPLERTTDLTSTYSAASINSQLDTIVAQIADLDDRVSRSISLNDYEVGVSLDLPATADRLGKTIQFNSSTGALEVGPSGDELTSLAGITSDITTVAGVASDLSTVATAASNINAVGLNISKVTTVSNNISTILSINSNISDIRDVADSITDINDIADSIDQVELVAGSISNVDTVALANSNISTVAGDINNINTVAGLSANITTVAGITGAISTVNSNAADITSVSNNIDDVNDVANVITKVTTVADNISNVNTLSSQASNIGTLAGISGSINSLGGISSDITTLAAVASDIGDAATNAASALSAKNAAEAARDATLAAYDSFDDRYLGAKSEEPTLDNDNNPLVAGSLYFDNNSNSMKLYTGSAWVAAYIAGNDYLALSGGTLTGQVNTTANITFGDNDKAIFGAGSDLQIYHSGSASYISENSSSGALLIQGEELVLENPDGTNYFRAATDGSVKLYNSGAVKLNTTSTGISVTGNATFADNGKAIFGSGSDLQIYHDGAGSYISDQGVGPLNLLSGGVRLKDTTDTTTMLAANAGGAVTLYHNNAPKLATTSTGIDVTGTVTADGLTVDGSATIKDATSPSLRFLDTNAANSDFTIYSPDGVNHLRIKAGSSATDAFSIASSGDISFYDDTGTTAKFFWDASAERLGLGTTSPLVPLQVNMTDANFGVANISAGVVQLGSTSTADDIAFGTIGAGPTFTEYMRIDNGTGNVGIGVTPETTTSTYKALELGYSTSILARTTANQSYFGNNAYHDSSWKYKTTDPAALYQQVDNQHVFFNAASGTADTTISFSEAMRIDSSGNVGIGTSSPSYPLDVSGSSFVGIQYTRSGTDSPAIRLSNATTGSLAQVEGNNSGDMIFKNGAGSLAERMRITSSGSVGIGTTSPSALLTVEDSGPIIEIKDTASSTYTQLANVSGDTYIGGDRAGVGGKSIIFRHTGVTEAMRIDSSGNVGIGTTDTSFVNGVGLKIANSTAARLTLADASYGVGSLDGFQFTAAGQDGYIYNQETGAIIFGTSGAEAMRIASDGDVFIGSTSSFNTASSYGGTGESRLVVAKEYTSAQGVDKPQMVGTFHAFTDGTPADGFAAAVALGAEGEVANQRGAIIVGGAEDVTSSSRDGYFAIGVSKIGSAYVHRFNIEGSTGSITASDTSIGTLSDERLKENIGSYSYDLSDFKSLTPKTFEWKETATSHPDGQQFGFIAQEVETVDSNWVSEYLVPAGDPDRNHLNGETRAKTTVLGKKDAMYVSVIQQLITKIEALESRVAALEAN